MSSHPTPASSRRYSVEQLHGRLQEALQELVTSDDWREALATAARFHTYSFSNTQLIWVQARARGFTPSRVAGYRAWQKMDRQVRRGERALVILAPVTRTVEDDGEEERRLVGFRPAHVFDVSQTDGPPLPEIRPVLVEGDLPLAWGSVQSLITDAGFGLTIDDSERLGGANGLTDFANSEVLIRSSLPGAQRFKTAVHELAHTELHGPPQTLSRCRGVVEVEAESVAYVVCSALGVDSSDYSLPYVASWSGGDLDKVAATAERVVRCAHRILTQLEEGRDLEQPQPARPIAAHRGGGVGDALEAAVAYYVEQLESQSASHAREYLAGRGIDPETVARWRLGYAPPGWEQLVGALGDAGFDEDLLVDAGLASRSRRGRLYDWMRGRIVFPVFDTDGRPRGFAGRLLDGEGPKYLNSPETDLYSKRRLLYGLDLARSSIEETGSCVVVEGYTDAIAAHHAGVTNTVATGGTALTSEHLASLRPLAATVTLCFDGDDGGRCAARRVSELPVASLTGLELRVASLPAGQDPASLVATGTPGVLRHLVARAVPLVESLITDVLDGHNLDEPEDAVRAIRAAGEVIARLTSTDTRDAAVSYLARTSGRSEQLVEQATGMTRGVGATTERATQR